MADQRQLVTRRRNPSLEQLDYPDCFDEYIGRTKTGRIIRGYHEVVYEEKNQSNKIEKEEKTLEKIVYKIVVETIYDTQFVDCIFNIKDYDLSSYKDELIKKFTSDIIKDVRVEKVCI